MVTKTKFIPVNKMANVSGTGITIERVAFTRLPPLEDGAQAHRHDGHGFFLLEQGSITIEIDFQQYKIKSSSVVYIHPNQVHRTIATKNVTVSSWAMTNENLNPEYLAILENLTPAKPLLLNKETFVLLSDAVSLSIRYAGRVTDKLHHSLLKDSCNALVAFVAAQYLAQAASTDKFSRFETVYKAFRELLEKNYTTVKRPAAYARELNISTPYLNECVKNTTGYSVSYHIQQRIILAAKRLLYYSDKSIKEIATELGYEDYPYFSRLFTKITGMTALTFRNKNHD